ncbi:MAG: hypothetical protein IMW89_18125 [Ktedonobacteraceae bacterium]|nr:hypothetical protein [Ktedonobacteraceae bacterium]
MFRGALSEPENGRIVITKHGFRSTGAIIELDPTRYDNPGKISITADGAVIFKNTTTFPIILCGGQNGECSRQAGQPSELNAPGLRLAPEEIRTVTFVNTGDYRIRVYTNETTFRYNSLTVHVEEK